MTRLEANKKILEKLTTVVHSCPDWRFQQILQNLGISSRFGEDLWYEESIETLDKINKATQNFS